MNPTNPFARFWAWLGTLGAPVQPAFERPTLAPVAREPVNDADAWASARQDARVAFLNRRLIETNNAHVTRDYGTHVEVVAYKPVKPLTDAELSHFPVEQEPI